jgi:predicted  nucleic acid-binding Zn-ribbon protein
MAIRDRDTRDALQTLETEFENLEATVQEKERDINELEQKISGLESQVEEYEVRIKELEDALAEAHLTSEADDDSGRDSSSEEQLEFQC